MSIRAQALSLTTRALAITVVLALGLAGPAAVLAGGAPSNDDLANAKLIVGALPYTDSISTTGASNETNETSSQCDASTDHSVWYKITMTRNRVVQVTTIGSDYDTQIDIFTGTNFNNLSPVDCNDDIDSSNPDLYTSRVNFRATAGQRYLIRVTDPQNSTGGMLTLHVRTVRTPANDNYAGATRISSLPFDANADNTNATRQSNEPDANYCDVARASRWYKFTPSQDMTIWANTFVPQDFDTVLGVYTGSQIGNAQQVICNDDTWANDELLLASGVTFKARAGVTYHFQVAGYAGESGAGHRLPFHVERVTPEPNDDFANAMTIAEPLAFNDFVNQRHTTREPNEPTAACLNSPMYNTAWYEFTPSTTASYVASAGSSINNMNPRVAIYQVTGPGFAGLSPVGCSTSVTFTGTAGTTYMLQLTEDNTVSGPITLTLDFD